MKGLSKATVYGKTAPQNPSKLPKGYIIGSPMKKGTKMSPKMKTAVKRKKVDKVAGKAMFGGRY